MNSCVQDAVCHFHLDLYSLADDSYKINLAWKLALVYKGYSPSELLDTYGEERLPVIAEMLGKTTELLNQFKETGGRNINRGNELRQLGVNYRGSSIVYEDDIEISTEKGDGYNSSSETAARPGDRAPGAPGLRIIGTGKEESIDIQDLYTPARHTILIFSNGGEDHTAVLEVVKTIIPPDVVDTVLILPHGATDALTDKDSEERARQFEKILVDDDGHAYAGYHVLEKPSVVVVRPDGVVGARVRAAFGLKSYFANIFNI